MNFYTVPPKALLIFRGISKLKATEAKTISSYIAEHLENLVSPTTAHEHIAKNPPGDFTSEQAFRWLDGLMPLIFEVLPRTSDADEVARGLVSSAHRASENTDEGALSPSALKKLHANLLSILDNPTTRLKAKALSLLNSHERVFSSCEIYSDIRPVFKADGEIKVEAAVVYHTLQLEHTGSEHAFTLSLDSRDLMSIKRKIDRALEKESALAKLISNAGVERIKIS